MWQMSKRWSKVWLSVLLCCCCYEGMGSVLSFTGSTPAVIDVSSSVASLSIANAWWMQSLTIKVSDWEYSDPSMAALPITLSMVSIPRITIVSTAVMRPNCSSSSLTQAVRRLDLRVTGGSDYHLSLVNLTLCNAATAVVVSASNVKVTVSALVADLNSSVSLSQLWSSSVVELEMPLSLSRSSLLSLTRCDEVSLLWVTPTASHSADDGTLTLVDQSSIIVRENTLVVHADTPWGPYTTSGISANIAEWQARGSASLVAAVIAHNSSLRIESNTCANAPCGVCLALLSLWCDSSAMCVVLRDNTLDARGAAAQVALFRTVYAALTVEVATFVTVSGDSAIAIETNTVYQEYSGLRVAVNGTMSLLGSGGSALFVCRGNLITATSLTQRVDPSVAQEINAEGGVLLDVSFEGSFIAVSDAAVGSSAALFSVDSNELRVSAGADGPWAAMLRVRHRGMASASGMDTVLNVWNNSVLIIGNGSTTTTFASSQSTAVAVVGWIFSGTAASFSDGASVQFVSNYVNVKSSATVSLPVTSLYGVAMIMVTTGDVSVSRRAVLSVSQNRVTLGGSSSTLVGVMLSAMPATGGGGIVVIASQATVRVESNSVSQPPGVRCGPGSGAFCCGVVLQYSPTLQLRSNSTLSVSSNNVSLEAVFPPSASASDPTVVLFVGVAVMNGAPRGTPVALYVCDGESVHTMQFNNVTLQGSNCNTVGVFAFGWTSVAASTGSMPLGLSGNTVSLTVSSGSILVAGVVVQSSSRVSSSSLASLSVSLSSSFTNVNDNVIEITATSTAANVCGVVWFGGSFQVGQGSSVIVSSNVCRILSSITSSTLVVGVGVFAYAGPTSSSHSAMIVLRSAQVAVDGNTVVLDCDGTAGVLLDVSSGEASGCTSSAPAALALIDRSSLSVSSNAVIRSTTQQYQVSFGVAVSASSTRCTAMALWRMSRVLVQSNVVRLPSTIVSDSGVYLEFTSSFYSLLSDSVKSSSGVPAAAVTVTTAMSAAAVVLTCGSFVVVKLNQLVSSTFSLNVIELYVSTGYVYESPYTLSPVSLLLSQNSMLDVSGNVVSATGQTQHGILMSMNFPIVQQVTQQISSDTGVFYPRVVTTGLMAWNSSQVRFSQNVISPSAPSSSTSNAFLAGVRLHFDALTPMCYEHIVQMTCSKSYYDAKAKVWIYYSYPCSYYTAHCDVPTAKVVFDLNSILAFEGNSITAAAGAILLDRSSGSAMQASWTSGSELRVIGNSLSSSPSANTPVLGAVDLFRCVAGLSAGGCYVSTDGDPNFRVISYQESNVALSAKSAVRIARNSVSGWPTGITIATQQTSLTGGSALLVEDNTIQTLTMSNADATCISLTGMWSIDNPITNNPASYWKFLRNRCRGQPQSFVFLVSGVVMDLSSRAQSVMMHCNVINNVIVGNTSFYTKYVSSVPKSMYVAMICNSQSATVTATSMRSQSVTPVTTQTRPRVLRKRYTRSSSLSPWSVSVSVNRSQGLSYSTTDLVSASASMTWPTPSTSASNESVTMRSATATARTLTMDVVLPTLTSLLSRASTSPSILALTATPHVVSSSAGWSPSITTQWVCDAQHLSSRVTFSSRMPFSVVSELVVDGYPMMTDEVLSGTVSDDVDRDKLLSLLSMGSLTLSVVLLRKHEAALVSFGDDVQASDILGVGSVVISQQNATLRVVRGIANLNCTNAFSFDDGEVLDVRFNVSDLLHQGSFACPLMARAFTLPMTHALSDAQKLMRSVAASSSLISLGLQMLTANAGNDLQSLIVVGLMSCTPRGSMRNGYSDMRALAPLLLEASFSSVIVSNLMLMGIVLAAQGCVIGLLWPLRYVKRRNFFRRSAPQEDLEAVNGESVSASDEDVVGSLDNCMPSDWKDGRPPAAPRKQKGLMSTARFPGMLISAFVFCYQGLLFSGIRLMQDNSVDPAQDHSLGLLALGIVVTVLLYPLPWIAYAMSDRVPRSFHRYLVPLGRTTQAFSLKYRLFSAVSALEPDGMLLPRGTGRVWGPLFSSSLPHPVWAAMPLLGGWLMCTAALFQFYHSSAFCASIYCLLAVCLAATGVATIAYGPRRCVAMNVVGAVRIWTNTLVLLSCAISVYSPYFRGDDTMMLVLGAAQTGATLFSNVLAFVTGFGDDIQKGRSSIVKLEWQIGECLSSDGVLEDERYQAYMKQRRQQQTSVSVVTEEANEVKPLDEWSTVIDTSHFDFGENCFVTPTISSGNVDRSWSYFDLYNNVDRDASVPLPLLLADVIVAAPSLSSR